MPTESTALLLDAMKGSGASAQTFQGNSPANATDTGNPVKIGGRVDTGTPTAATTGQRDDAWFTANGAQVQGAPVVSGGDGQANAGLQSLAAPTGVGLRLLTTGGFIFNGTSWDRQRGDTSGTYLAAATFWTESAVNAQAAAAVVNGSTRNNGGLAGGVGTRFNLFVAEAFADQAGTLYIDKSVDGGTTWRQVASVAVVAGTSSQISTRISAASYRARYVNGGTATTAFLLTSSYTLA